MPEGSPVEDKSIKGWLEEQAAKKQEQLVWFVQNGGAPHLYDEWVRAGTAAKAAGKLIPQPTQFAPTHPYPGTK